MFMRLPCSCEPIEALSCTFSAPPFFWVNAVAESFFHTLKTELIHHEDLQTREEPHQSIFEYIKVFYNRQRKHPSNSYRTVQI